jgi:hypothetical protein
MKSILTGITFLGLMMGTAKAQTLGYFLTDLKGDPILNNYSKVTEGSPFFNAEWLKGRAVDMDGKIYDNLSVRLNLLDPGIHYLDDKQQEFRMSIPMKALTLTDYVNGRQYSFIRAGSACQGNPQAWYQVLDSGHAFLLKYETRTLTEVKPYGSAVPEEHIKPLTRYYLLVDKKCEAVKSPLELWENLQKLKPGFAEKPGGKTNAKKIEDELVTLARSFNR